MIKKTLSRFTVFVGAVVLLAFVAVTLALIWPSLQGGSEPSQIAVYLLGNLTGMATTVVAFLYGSSQGSREKDQLKEPPTI